MGGVVESGLMLETFTLSELWTGAMESHQLDSWSMTGEISEGFFPELNCLKGAEFYWGTLYKFGSRSKMCSDYSFHFLYSQTFLNPV